MEKRIEYVAVCKDFNLDTNKLEVVVLGYFDTLGKALNRLAGVAVSREPQVLMTLVTIVENEGNKVECWHGRPCSFCNMTETKPGGWHCPHCGGC